MKSILLHYEGARLDERQGMDPHVVAECIDAFADFLVLLLQEDGAEDPEAIIKVRALRAGSLDIEFLVDLAAIANTVLGSISGHSLIDLIKSVFALLKFLGGEPPRSIKQAADGGVLVENNSGQVNVFNQSSVHLVVNGTAGQSAEQFVKQPLRHDADRVEVRFEDDVIGFADRSEAASFSSISEGVQLGEFVSEQHVTIQTVVLEGDGLWRFGTGRQSFRATIEDESFLRSVRSGRERFGRGDILKVRLRSKQEKVRNRLRTTHVIERVISHERVRNMQQRLF